MANKAVVHVRTVRYKTSEMIIGFRLEAAVPNQEGRVMRPLGEGDFYATKEPTTSFKKPYFIAESSDYSYIRKQEIERFLDKLRWSGFQEFEFFGKYEGQPLANLVVNHD